MQLKSIRGVCDVEIFPAGSDADGRSDLLIEIPHGATRGEDFMELRARLCGDYPPDLQQFFFVNTDVGAPEVGRRVALELTEGAGSGRRVLIVRSRIPRAFVDCNRDVTYRGNASDGAPLTPGFPGYVTDEGDRSCLYALHREYHEVAQAAYEAVCGAGGMALCLHTYAPKSVQIYDVDDGIVAALHDAYRPENYERWTTRPAVEIIGAAEDGSLLAPPRLVAELSDSYARAGFRLARDETYRLHAGSMGFVYASRYPKQVLSMEIRRDLLVESFIPFRPMRVSTDKVAALAGPLTQALARTLPPGSATESGRQD